MMCDVEKEEVYDVEVEAVGEASPQSKPQDNSFSMNVRTNSAERK